MKLTGRTILITGGSSGIGFELAKQLLKKGNVVVITGRNSLSLDKAASQLPGLHTYQSDVSDSDSIRSLYEAVTQRFPNLDTLVNNAGIMRALRLQEERSLEDVAQEIDIDLTGPIRMVQQFLLHLQRRPDAMIVNMSSGLAFVPFPISPIYSAAKAAMHAYTRCLRVQLRGMAIAVIEIAPPLTETPLYLSEFAGMMKGQKGMAVDTLVQSAIKAIESGKTEIRPGQSNILKIASRLAPEFMFRQLSKVGLA
jgi:uncharacterized oxidoreductase